MSNKKLLKIGIILSAIVSNILILFLGYLLIVSYDMNRSEKNSMLKIVEENGDFLYQKVLLDDEGQEIKSFKKTSKCVESYIRILGLSEEGRKKEIIIVPHYIDGIEVKEIGRRNFLDTRGYWYSDALKKVYIPFQAVVWDVIRSDEKYCPNLEKIIIVENELAEQTYYKNDDIYITSLHHEDLNNSFSANYASYRFIYCANVSYMYNYNDSPNHGYYWIDDYDYGTHITFIPDNPTREGYIFDGWYKEEECINKWDFETDVLSDIEYIKPGYPEVKYQETILYAKWVKDE